MQNRTRHLPLDGEILDAGHAGGAAGAHALRLNAEIIGYETVETGCQPAATAPLRAPVRAASDGLAMLRTARLPEHGDRRPEPLAGRLLKVTGFIVAGAAFWINGGHALFTGGAGADLFIAELNSRMEVRGGETMLRVDTRVENRGGQSARLPAILVSVRGKDGSTAQYKLGTSRAGLEPGGSHLFSGHVAAPRLGVDRVSVRLDSKRDG